MTPRERTTTPRQRTIYKFPSFGLLVEGVFLFGSLSWWCCWVVLGARSLPLPSIATKNPPHPKTGNGFLVLVVWSFASL